MCHKRLGYFTIRVGFYIIKLYRIISSFVFNKKFWMNYRWTDFRAQQALEKVVGEGLCWIDEQDNPVSYWFPSLFPGKKNRDQ